MKKYLQKLAKLIFSLGLKPIRPKNGSPGFLIYSSLTPSDVNAIKDIASHISGWSAIYTESKFNQAGEQMPAKLYCGPVKDNSMTLDELIAHSMGE
jgi:pantoate kinase